MATKQNAIVVVFPERSQAQAAVRELHAAGFTDRDIGMVARDEQGRSHVVEGHVGHDSKVGEGAAVGAAVGAGTGALWALGIAAGVLPALGPVIAGGTLTAILASAAGGAVAASLVGLLIGAGLPEAEARYYEDEVAQGRTLVVVNSDARRGEALDIMERYKTHDYLTRPTATSVAATTSTTSPTSPMPRA